MIKFTEYVNKTKQFSEEQETGAVLFPDHTPMYMKAELQQALPKQIMELFRAFKNQSLSKIQKDIQNAEFPSVNMLRGYDQESRSKLVANGVLKIHGNKLFIIGNFSRNLAIERLLSITHGNDDFDLATDASPIAVKIIIERAIQDRILPHDTKITDLEDNKFANLKVSFADGGVDYNIATFPFTRYKNAPRMFLDYLRRHFTTNLYYDIEKEELIDLGHGLASIAKKKIHPIGGDLSAKIRENPINAITYIAQFSSINEAGPDTKDIDPSHSSALNNTKLSISNRKDIIRAFKKGIKDALNKSNYIKLLAHFGILQQILPFHDLNLNIKNGKISKIPSVIIAQLLSNHWNNEHLLRDALSQLGLEPQESNDVVFLVKLPHYSASEVNPNYGTSSFHHDRLKSNLSVPIIIEFVEILDTHNRQWVTQELGRSSFTDKHLRTTQPIDKSTPETRNPIQQNAHHDIKSLWNKAHNYYEHIRSFAE